MKQQIFTKKQLEAKVTEIANWLSKNESSRLKNLKIAQRVFYIEKLTHMDEKNLDKIVING